MEDSRNYHLKPRFGLFSSPYPLTCGDTNQDTTASSRRDPSTGEVITEPRGMYGGRLGQGPENRVHHPGQVTWIPGGYSKPKYHGNSFREYVPENKRKATGGHESEFFPAKATTHRKAAPLASYEDLP